MKIIKKFAKFILIFAVIFSWVFGGWPQIWQNPRIPPEIQEVKAAPGTQIKTVEFFITQYANATDITTGLGVNGLTYADANDVIVNINLPETGVMTIRQAWIEWQTMSASNVATDWQMKFARCTAAPSCTTSSTRTANTLFPTVVSDPIVGGARGQVFIQHMDVTSQIVSGNNDYFFNARLTGDTRNSDSAKIFITYEYDDTSTTQLKTRRYLVGCGAAQAAAGDTTNYTVNPNILETGVTVVQHWVEMTGSVALDGNHNSVMNATAATAVHTTAFGGTSIIVKLLNSFATANINLTTNNTIGLTNTTAAMNLKCAEWVVTYTYTGSSATQSNTAVYRAGQLSGSLPATQTTVGSPVVNLPENTPTFRSVYVRYVFTNNVAGNFTPEVTIGATTCTGPAFAIAFGGRQVGYDVVVWNINDSGGVGNCLNFFQTNWTNGATITIKGAGGVANAAEGVYAELVASYTYNNSASATGIKTVFWWLGQDDAVNAASTAFTGTFNTFIPETTTTKRSSGIRVHYNVGTAASTDTTTIAGAAATSVAYAAHSRGDTRWSNDAGTNLTAASQTALAFSFNSNEATGFISGGYGYTTYEFPFPAAAQTLTFSLGANSLALGTLSTTAVTSGSHTLTVGSNAANGVAVTYSGATLTSGANTITAMSTAAASSVGTEQFGVNAVANTTPVVGAACSGTTPIAAAATGYATANNFKFVSSETIVSSTGSINNTTCTISYIANISAATEAGSYNTNLTYVATGNF